MLHETSNRDICINITKVGKRVSDGACGQRIEIRERRAVERLSSSPRTHIAPPEQASSPC